MNTLKIIYNQTKSALFDDRANLIMVIFQVLAFVIALIVWINIIEKREIFVYSVTQYFPLQIYSLIIAIHLLLAIYSYPKDKHVSHLLLGASSFLILITITLELFYIFNR